MGIEEIKNISNEMLTKLVNGLGLDGNYYVHAHECLITFSDCDGICKFLTARSKPLKRFLERKQIDDRKKKYIYNEGLIVINHNMKDLVDEKDKRELLVKVVHEKLHSNRMLLINSQYSDHREVSSVLYDDNRFLVHDKANYPHYADSSQDILKASIDDSKETIDKYSKLSLEEKEHLTNISPQYEDKMEIQHYVDEALVETMAIISWILYKNNNSDVLEAVKYLNSRADGDIKCITNIILRHNDLELFKWMLDPITYEEGFVNYDFFTRYVTEDDQEDLDNLVKAAIQMDEEYFDNGRGK